jgi:hypothetical protein
VAERGLTGIEAIVGDGFQKLPYWMDGTLGQAVTQRGLAYAFRQLRHVLFPTDGVTTGSQAPVRRLWS